jgi:hypothetical protein
MKSFSDHINQAFRCHFVNVNSVELKNSRIGSATGNGAIDSHF